MSKDSHKKIIQAIHEQGSVNIKTRCPKCYRYFTTRIKEYAEDPERLCLRCIVDFVLKPCPGYIPAIALPEPLHCEYCSVCGLPKDWHSPEQLAKHEAHVSKTTNLPSDNREH